MAQLCYYLYMQSYLHHSTSTYLQILKFGSYTRQLIHLPLSPYGEMERERHRREIMLELKQIPFGEKAKSKVVIFL